MTGVKDIVTIMAKATKFKCVLESRIPGRVQAGTSRVHGQAGSHSKTKEDLRVTQLGRNQQRNVSAGWPTGVATGGLSKEFKRWSSTRFQAAVTAGDRYGGKRNECEAKRSQHGTT